jgi:hypothetical protein
MFLLLLFLLLLLLLLLLLCRRFKKDEKISCCCWFYGAVVVVVDILNVVVLVAVVTIVALPGPQQTKGGPPLLDFPPCVSLLDKDLDGGILKMKGQSLVRVYSIRTFFFVFWCAQFGYLNFIFPL